MTCLAAILGFFFPRLTIVGLWLFTDYLEPAFPHWAWPVLGFLFMPLTTLAFAFSFHAFGGPRDLGLVLVIVAVVIDLGIVKLGSDNAGRNAARRRR